jgi:putative flavoprotein involved in K+ transport
VNERLETVIVGGGQAGLALSWHLSRLGREHVILERCRIGEAWRTERWDSLVFQFPNWTLRLPGYGYEDDDPDGFAPREEVVRFLERYAALIGAPLRAGIQVKSIQQKPGGDGFLVQTEGATIEAANVVIATGAYHVPVVPAFSSALPAGVTQVHSKGYRQPEQLPPGAVLVVGSAASGSQIAEELHESGRRVFLSVGERYRRSPRRYRGRDMFWWLHAMGIWDRPIDLYPEIMSWRIPLVTGVNGGHDIDLRRFREEGMTLVGRASAVRGQELVLAGGLEDTLKRGDDWFAWFTKSADDHASAVGIDLPEAEPPEVSTPLPSDGSDPILRLNLKAVGIGSVVWATGFRYDFSWVQLPVFNETGAPIQRRGVTPCPGLYFLGLRRMYTVNSTILSGVGKDAAYLAENIAGRG